MPDSYYSKDECVRVDDEASPFHDWQGQIRSVHSSVGKGYRYKVEFDGLKSYLTFAESQLTLLPIEAATRVRAVLEPQQEMSYAKTKTL